MTKDDDCFARLMAAAVSARLAVAEAEYAAERAERAAFRGRPAHMEGMTEVTFWQWMKEERMAERERRMVVG